MSPYSLWCAAISSALVVQASIAGCSSSSSPGAPVAGDDAATGAEGGGTDAGGVAEGGSVMDAGSDGDGALTCEASVLPPADAGGACNECLKANCMTELAACASDCVCAPIVACLELTNLNNYPGCNGLGAIESSETSLTNFAGCAANPAKCQGPCFTNDAGGD